MAVAIIIYSCESVTGAAMAGHPPGFLSTGRGALTQPQAQKASQLQASLPPHGKMKQSLKMKLSLYRDNISQSSTFFSLWV